VVRGRLLANIAKSKGENKKKKLKTYKYLFNNRDGLLDLDKRGLPVKHFCTLGAAEGNVDKLVCHRMRGRGCSWSWSGARAMLAVLPHVQELSQHVFEYRPVAVGQSKKTADKENRRSWLPTCVCKFVIFVFAHKSGKTGKIYQGVSEQQALFDGVLLEYREM